MSLKVIKKNYSNEKHYYKIFLRIWNLIYY